MSECRLCPRTCKARRDEGQRGICGQTSTVMLARAALHYWEEPPISGEEGSGTVFFSGCPLGCVYCQNAPISMGGTGKPVDSPRLAEIFLELQEKGALNINLVTPTHYARSIVAAVRTAREHGLSIPIVYNTSGYETLETLESLRGHVQVFLTDYKYSSPMLAEKYSNAADYPAVADAALDKMFDIAGPYSITGGKMERGVIVRHLLLPGHLDDTKAVIRRISEKDYKDSIWVSIMNQYTPLPEVGRRYPELATRVAQAEYDAAIDYAMDLGLENVFIQEGGTAEESFIPLFDFEGI